MEYHISTCPGCTADVSKLDQATDDFVAILRASSETPDTEVLLESQLKSSIAAIAELELSALDAVNGDADEARFSGGEVGGDQSLNQDDGRTIPPSTADIASPETERHAVGDMDSATTSDWCPDNYELLNEVARGGMGVVYRARQISAERVVALKVVKHGNPNSDDVERFLAEARAAARLNHPNIVPVYEVGEGHTHPYFTMQFVNGPSLARRIDGQPLAANLAATLMMKVADAIQFAHDNQIIHRDIKPGNILLNGKDEPFVTDFGLARLMDQASDLTTEGQVMGTPSYMPPEQALGRRDHVNEQSDVYSLGAVLYYSVTGRPPFQTASSMATVMQLLNQEPVPPRRLNPDVPADIETICLKCLQKDPAHRYESAAALAEDLRRFLHHEPILARPAGRVERTAKWIRRHPTWTALVATGLVALVAISIALTGNAYNRQLQTSLDQTEASRRIAEQREQETARALSLADEANEKAKNAEYFHRIAMTANDLDAGDYRSARETFGLIDNTVKSWEYRYLHDVLYAPSSGKLKTQSNAGVLTLRIHRDGSRGAFLEAGAESQFAFFDSNTAEVTRRVSVGANVGNQAWLNEDLSQATVVRTVADETQAELWDLESGDLEKTVAGLQQNTRPVSSPDGRFSVICGVPDAMPDEPGMSIVDWHSSRRSVVVEDKMMTAIAAVFRSNGTRCYVATRVLEKQNESTLLEFSVPEWKLLQQTPLSYRVGDLILNEESEEIVASGADQRLRRVRWDDFDEVLRSDVVPYMMRDLRLSDDGTKIVVGGDQGPVDEYDADTLTPLTRHVGQLFQSQQVAYAENSGRVWASGMDGHLRHWPAGKDSNFLSLSAPGERFATIAFNKAGTILAGGSHDRAEIRLWNTSTGKTIRVMSAPEETVRRSGGMTYLAFVNNEEQILSMDWGGVLRLWDTASGTQLNVSQDDTAGAIQGGCLSPDGRFALSANQDQSVNVWALPQLNRIHRVRLNTQQFCCAISPDGRLVAAGGKDFQNPPRVWEVTDGMESLTAGTAIPIDLPKQTCWSLAFSPDGQYLAAGDVFNQIRVVSTTTWKTLWNSYSHVDVVKGIVFSPDSTRMVSCSTGGRVVVSETKTGQEIIRLKGHTGAVTDVTFSTDGKLIATCSAHEGIRIWPSR